MANAKWTIGTPTKSVSADGTATIAAPLLDNGVKQGTLRLTMTAERNLTVLWEQEPGVVGLAGFQAWSKESG